MGRSLQLVKGVKRVSGYTQTIIGYLNDIELSTSHVNEKIGINS